MKKLLNNPWVVGLLVAGALFFVTQAAFKKKPSYASATIYEDESAYDDFSTDYADPDAGSGSQPSTTGSGDVMQALDALVASSEPVDLFGTRHAQIISTDSEQAEPDTLTIHLSAVWVQGSQTLVLINDRIRGAGESIGDVTIESATIDGIWLNHPDGRDFLPIGGHFNWEASPQPEGPNPNLALNDN